MQFVTYLSLQSQAAKSKGKRKSHKLFKQMSGYISSRTPQQCRSHFQKMIKKHKTVAKLKRHVRESVGPSQFRKRVQEIEEELAVLLAEQPGKQQDASTQTDGQLWLVAPGTGMPNFSPSFCFPLTTLAPFTGLYQL